MEQNDLMESESNVEIIETDRPAILNELCRICGENNEQMVPVFGKHEHQLADKINKYLPITVTKQDDLPLQACITCVVVIIQWHTLLGSCIKTNEKLLCMLRQKHRGDQLDKNRSLSDSKNVMTEVKVDQLLREVKSKTGRHQGSQSLSVNEEKLSISESNYPTKPCISYRSQQTRNNDPTSTSLIYEDICEDEIHDNVANNDSLDTTVIHARHSDDVEIVDNIFKSPADVATKMTKVSKLQKIKDLLKKAQIKVEGKILYHCKKCVRNFPSHIDYVYHVKSHIRPESAVNECNSCGKQFHTKLHLIRHTNKHHLKVKKLICAKCRKVFDSPKKMDHKELDSITDTICNACKESNRIVYTSATISDNGASSDEDCPKQCTNCHHFFPSEPSLEVHISENSCHGATNGSQSTKK